MQHFHSLWRHWNKIPKLTKVYPLILVRSGYSHKWIGYQWLSKKSVADWVLKLKLLCHQHKAPLSHTAFSSIEWQPLKYLLLEDGWKKQCHFMCLVGWILQKGKGFLLYLKEIVGEDWDSQDEFSAVMNCWDENCFASLPLSMLCWGLCVQQPPNQ